MSHTPIAGRPAGEFVETVAKGAVLGYWLHNATSGDQNNVEISEDSHRRILPTVEYHNDLELAGNFAGAWVGAGIFYHFILVPYWIVTLVLFELPAIIINDIGGGNLQPAKGAQVLGIILAVLWLYLGFWKSLKWLQRHAPKLSQAEDYRGVLAIRQHEHPRPAGGGRHQFEAMRLYQASPDPKQDVPCIQVRNAMWRED